MARLIWTALPSRFQNLDKRTPTADEVLDHLPQLDGTKRDNAERYIRLAPLQWVLTRPPNVTIRDLVMLPQNQDI